MSLQELKEFPVYSGVTGACGLLTTISFLALGSNALPLDDLLRPVMLLTLFASPYLSVPVAIGGGIDLFSKSRSGFSKIFSLAAIGASLGGIGILASASGPDAMGAIFATTIGLGVGGAANVVSFATRNFHAGVNFSHKKP